MEKIKLSPTDLINLKDLFSENYLLIKQIKEFEKKTINKEQKLILKEIRDVHKKNLLTIMKLLDNKERILWWMRKKIYLPYIFMNRIY